MAEKRSKDFLRGPLKWQVLAMVAVLIGVQVAFALLGSVQALPYSDFRSALAEGKVEAVTVNRERISGVYRGTEPEAKRAFSTIRVDDPELFAELRARQVKVEGASDPGFWRTWGIWLLPLFAMWLWGRLRTTGVGGPAGALSMARSRAKLHLRQESDVGFADVAGVDEAKVELQEVIDFLRTPEKFQRLGGKLPKGILLVGPPGTGKTLLARAVAGEAKVPFFSISGSDFVELFVGVGAARVRDLFEEAKAKAPCIIFIDELDALGRARNLGPTAHEEREQTLNQLLVEMDGFETKVGVVLMAATNRPEILDPALLRPGRFDRHVVVDRPDRSGRLDILKVHARNVALESEADLEGIAAMTPGMVGADLANIVNEAALLAVRRGSDKVRRAELEEAVERVIAGLEKRSRVLNRAEKHRVAHHEIGHALVALAFPGLDELKKISVIPRGISALGYTLQLPTEDRFLMTQRELEDKVAMLLGGRVAEALTFGDISTGAQDDLRKATEIARHMVRAYGMSQALGPVSLELSPHLGQLRAEPGDAVEHSEALRQRIDAEVRSILNEQEERVTTLLQGRMDVLRRAAADLLVKEVMTGDELRSLVDAPGEAPSPTRVVAFTAPLQGPIERRSP